MEFVLKVGLAFGDGGSVASRVDPDRRSTAGAAGELAKQVEVAAVRSEEEVAGERLEDSEGVGEICSDAGIGRFAAGRVDEADAGIDVPAANDDGLQGTAVVGDLQGPRGAAPGVAWGFMRDEDGAAEMNCVAIVQDAIDPGGWVESAVAVGEVCATARFYDGYVCVHHHVAGAGEVLDCGAAGGVVDVGVADEQDLDVGEAEAELFDAVTNLRHRLLEVGVDEDVARGGDDKKGREVLAADVIEVVRKTRREGEGSSTGGSFRRQAEGVA